MASRGVRRLPPAAVIAAGAVAAAVVTWRTRPVIAIDDAAISFRYAERLATGHGLTYNDGEHVLGASSGVHTLLLAMGRWLGLSVPTAALLLGIVGTAAATALVGLIAARLGGRTPAAVAMGLFIAGPVRWYASSGLESATLLACCLGAVAAWQARRERTAGLLLGLAVVAKLDAGALAVALVGASLLVRRRVPVRLLGWSLIVAGPWFAWVAATYGHPLPQSFRSKVSGRAEAPGYRYDPSWVLRRIDTVLPAAIAGGAVALVRRPDDVADGSREIRIGLLGWLVVAAAAASLLPLGASYPWYVTPLYGPIAVLAGDAVGWARRVLAPVPGAPGRDRRPALAAIAVVGLVAVSVALGARTVVADLADGPVDGPAAAQWRDNRAAGRYVEEHHPGEVVETCFGWSGYAAASLRIADPCAINSPWPTVEADVRITSLRRAGEALPAGWCEEARFDRAARRGPDGAVVVVLRRC